MAMDPAARKRPVWEARSKPRNIMSLGASGAMARPISLRLDCATQTAGSFSERNGNMTQWRSRFVHYWPGGAWLREAAFLSLATNELQEIERGNEEVE